MNLPAGAPYSLGDANLDGFVDVADFYVWNMNKFTDRILWSQENFNADQVMDVSDFNLWNLNKIGQSGLAVFEGFQSTDGDEERREGLTDLVLQTFGLDGDKEDP